ncbi:MAG: hypothetical protein KDA60_19145 [Planctomycetales bacterium]|nr:hypothetical protein [Planctomycetales bacterium]
MCEISAYHEAGHAFMAMYLGVCVRSVTIDPEWDDGPERYADVQIEWPRNQFAERELHRGLVRVALAGPVAEMIHTGEPYHPGFIAEWASDWQLAWNSAKHLVKQDRQRLAFLEQMTADVYRLLHRDEHWHVIAAIVDALLAHETLEAAEVQEIFRQWMT